MIRFVETVKEIQQNNIPKGLYQWNMINGLLFYKYEIKFISTIKQEILVSSVVSLKNLKFFLYLLRRSTERC